MVQFSWYRDCIAESGAQFKMCATKRGVMLKGKHLVMIAAAIGLLIGPIPSEATVILQAVAGTVQVGGPGGVGKDFGPRKVPHMPPGVGSPPQFVFDQDAGPPADTRRYEADFDFPNDGIVHLTLRYLPGQSTALGPTIWRFDDFDFGTMSGKIPNRDSVVLTVAGPTPASKALFMNGLGLQIILGPTSAAEQGRWEFDINFVSTSSTAPTPGTIFLIGVGLLGLARTRRRS